MAAGALPDSHLRLSRNKSLSYLLAHHSDDDRYPRPQSNPSPERLLSCVQRSGGFQFFDRAEIVAYQTQRRRFCETVPADVLDRERLLFSFLDTRNSAHDASCFR